MIAEYQPAPAAFNHTIFFGSYPQCGTAGIKQPIEWIILEENDEEMLLLSQFCLETCGFLFPNPCPPYPKCWDFSYQEMLWEFSYLRRWLNNEFYNTAFSDFEKEQILNTVIQTVDNDVSPLETFDNQVFLLSADEVEKYLPEPNMRRAAPTKHADCTGAQTIDGCAWWWLLPHVEVGFGTLVPGHGPDQGKHFKYHSVPQVISADGEIGYHSRNIHESDWTVRPVIRIRQRKTFDYPNKEVSLSSISSLLISYEGREVIWEDGRLKFRNTCSPNDPFGLPTLYRDLGIRFSQEDLGEFYKQHTIALSNHDIERIKQALSDSHFLSWKSDEDSDEIYCGAHYSIFRCTFSDKSTFQYKTRFRPCQDFTTLASFFETNFDFTVPLPEPSGNWEPDDIWGPVWANDDDWA